MVIREKCGYFLTLLLLTPHRSIMEEIFSDALGLLGAEAWEDDGYVHYGGLKLGIVPKVRFQKQKKMESLFLIG